MGVVNVVLVRPYRDRRGGGGCCGGDADHGVCVERSSTLADDIEVRRVGDTYVALRRAFADRVNVQVVSATNTAYLVPASFRAARPERGTWGALRAALRSNAAGSVLVDGTRIGDLEELGTAAVLREVERRVLDPGQVNRRPRQDSNLRPTD